MVLGSRVTWQLLGWRVSTVNVCISRRQRIKGPVLDIHLRRLCGFWAKKATELGLELLPQRLFITAAIRWDPNNPKKSMRHAVKWRVVVDLS